MEIALLVAQCGTARGKERRMRYSWNSVGSVGRKSFYLKFNQEPIFMYILFFVQNATAALTTAGDQGLHQEPGTPKTQVLTQYRCRSAGGMQESARRSGGLSRHGPSPGVARKAAYSSHLTPTLCACLAPQMLALCRFRCVLFSLGFHAIFLALNVIPGWLLKNVNFFQQKSHLQSKTKNLFIFPGCQR